jgi:hypothetical protein
MTNHKDRVRKSREHYEAVQARQKRVQDVCELLGRPGVLLKISIVLGVCLITSLGFLDPIFKLLGFDPR